MIPTNAEAYPGYPDFPVGTVIEFNDGYKLTREEGIFDDLPVNDPEWGIRSVTLPDGTVVEPVRTDAPTCPRCAELEAKLATVREIINH